VYNLWKSARFLSRRFPGKFRRCSGGNPLATLAAAAVQNLTAAFGAHANPEAMGLFAPAIIGLKGSFHRLLSPRNNGRATISQGIRRVK
jgi:hypothetical protein